MSTSSPLPPDGAEPVPVPVAIPTTTAPVPGVSRSDRAADALISSYLRELLADDAARGRSAATESR
jgi:hypothetical protein